MKTSDIESSLFKYLYDNLEVPKAIKIFESVFYVDFTTYSSWVVIDPLSNSVGATPRANFALHISIKNGLRNATVVLNRLVDEVTPLFSQYQRIPVYEDATGNELGAMELCDFLLLPTQRHAGGGEFRTLNVSFVYPGEIPLV